MRHIVVMNEGVSKSALMEDYNVIRNSPSPRRFIADMTEEEAVSLRLNEDVLAVENIEDVALKIVDDGSVQRDSSIPGPGPIDINAKNWGRMRHSSPTNPFSAIETLHTEVFDPIYEGEGVDMVFVASTMVNIDNEGYKTEGVSRIQEFQWNTLIGMEDMATIDYSERPTSIHAESVLAIACHNDYGWATRAEIYIIPRSQESTPTDYFDAARCFHQQKGNSRPTVCFAAFGAEISSVGISESVYYRGVDYTEYNHIPLSAGWGSLRTALRFGLSAKTKDHSIHYFSQTAQELTDAGVHLVVSAGNKSQKYDVPGGVDYDNARLQYGIRKYYCRPTSLASSDTILVANLASAFDEAFEGEYLWATSSRGPRVDCCAAGTYIPIVSPAGNYSATGTSFSCPQIAGMLGVVLGKYPSTTPAQSRKFFREIAIGTDTLVGTSPSMYVANDSSGDLRYWEHPTALRGYSGNIAYLDPTLPFDPSTITDTSITYPADLTTSTLPSGGDWNITEPADGKLQFTTGQIQTILDLAVSGLEIEL